MQPADGFHFEGGQEFEQSWDTHIGLSPAAFMGTLFSNVRDRGTISDAVFSKFALNYNLFIHQAEKLVLEAERTIFVEEGSVSHDGMTVEPEFQNRSYGKVLLRNSVNLYKELGLREVHVSPGLDIGGYVQAAYGFCPRSVEEWEKVKGSIALTYVDYYKVLRSDTKAVIELVLKSRDPRDIWYLTLLAERVEEVKVGLILLKDVKWKGILDLRDSVVLGRCLNYVREAVIDYDDQTRSVEGQAPPGS